MHSERKSFPPTDFLPHPLPFENIPYQRALPGYTMSFMQIFYPLSTYQRENETGLPYLTAPANSYSAVEVNLDCF